MNLAPFVLAEDGAVGPTYTVPSETAVGVIYHVRTFGWPLEKSERWVCDCPRARRGRRGETRCKHVDAAVEYCENVPTP